MRVKTFAVSKADKIPWINNLFKNLEKFTKKYKKPKDTEV